MTTAGNAVEVGTAVVADDDATGSPVITGSAKADGSEETITTGCTGKACADTMLLSIANAAIVVGCATVLLSCNSGNRLLWGGCVVWLRLALTVVVIGLDTAYIVIGRAVVTTTLATAGDDHEVGCLVVIFLKNRG